MILRILLILSLFSFVSCGGPGKSQRWLVIGDELAFEGGGWVYQLQQERKGGDLLNVSRPELTGAFNLNRDRQLNASEQINNYLRRAYAEMGGLDVIIIALGLNDCRDEFIGRDQDRREGFAALLERIPTFFTERGQDMPKVVVATPARLPSPQGAGSGFERTPRCLDELAVEIRDLVLAQGFCLADWQQSPGEAIYTQRPSPGELTIEGNRMLVNQLLKDCF